MGLPGPPRRASALRTADLDRLGGCAAEAWVGLAGVLWARTRPAPCDSAHRPKTLHGRLPLPLSERRTQTKISGMPQTRARFASVLAAPLFALFWPAGAWAQLGSSYCPAVANSTGAPARLVALGSLDVSLGQLELRCEGLPAGSVGVFLFGQSAASLPGHAGSLGTLCLAAPFVRDPLGALQATASGVVRRHSVAPRRSPPATRCGSSTGTATRLHSVVRRTRATVSA